MQVLRHDMYVQMHRDPSSDYITFHARASHYIQELRVPDENDRLKGSIAVHSCSGSTLSPSNIPYP